MRFWEEAILSSEEDLGAAAGEGARAREKDLPVMEEGFFGDEIDALGAVPSGGEIVGFPEKFRSMPEATCGETGLGVGLDEIDGTPPVEEKAATGIERSVETDDMSLRIVF